jgi:tetratricopeptide (TPR) repeat protein
LGRLCIFNGALEIYDLLLKVNPENKELRISKARCLEESGDFDGALKIFDEELSSNPDNLNFWLGKILCLRHKGTSEAAAVVLEEALNIFGNHKDLLLAKARLLEAQGKLKEADDALQQRSDDKVDKDLLLARARNLEMQGNFDAAIYFLNKAIAEFPDDRVLLLSKVRCLENMEYLEEARAFCEHCLTKFDGDQEFLLAQTFILRRMGEGTEAMEIFACQLDKSGDLSVLLTKCRLLQEEGKIDRALLEYDQALQRYPEDKRLWIGKIICLESKGDLQQAEKIFEKLPEIIQRDKDILLCKARLAQQLKQYPRALAIYRFALELSRDDDKSLLLGKAHCLEEHGMHDDAMAAYDYVLKKYPDDKEVCLSCGIFLSDSRVYAQALSLFEKVLKCNPYDKAALIAKANTLRELGDIEQALEIFNYLDGRYPNDRGVLLSYAICLTRKKCFGKAISILEGMLKKFPRDKKILLTTMRCYQESGDFTGTAQTCKRALGTFADDKDVCLGSAVALQQQKDFASALNILDKALTKYPNDEELLLVKGRCFREMGHFQDAIKLFQGIIDNNAKCSIAVWLSLAFCLAEQKDHDGLMKLFDDVFKRYPDNYDFLLFKARYFEDIKDFSASLEAFSRALTCYPNDRTLLLGVARCQEEKKDFPAAIAVFDAALSYYADDELLWLGKIRCLEEAGNLEAALACFSEALQKFKNDKDLLLAKARCLQKMGQAAQAVVVYDLALKCNQGDKSLLISKARCLEEKGDAYGALAIWKDLFAIYPKDIEIIVDTARCLELLGAYTEALNLLSAALSQNPDSYDLLLGKAHCLENKGNFDGALAAFDEALKTYPNDKTILLSKIFSLEVKGDFTKALELTNEALVNFPADREFILAKGRCLEGKDNFVEAIAAFDEGLRKFADDKDFLLAKARCLQKMGVYRESLEVFTYALRKFPNDRELLLGRAHCLELKEAFEPAVAEFASLSSQYPHDKSLVLGYILCLEKKGDYNKALERLNDALRQFPDDQELLLAKARCFQDKEDFDGALEVFNYALEKLPASKELLLGKGFCLEAMGAFDRAAHIFDYTLNKYEKNDVNIWLAKIHCLQNKGDFGEAERLFYYALRHYPNNYRLLLDKGHCLQKMGKFDEAIKVFDEALVIYKNDIKLLQGKACCFEEKEDFASALAIFDEALRHSMNNRLLLLGKSRCLEKAGNFDEALRVLDDALSKYPESSLLIGSKAHLLRRMGRVDRALELYEDCYFITKSRIGKVRCLAMQSDFSKALQECRTALASDLPIEEIKELLISEVYLLLKMKLHKDAEGCAAKLCQKFAYDSKLQVQLRLLFTKNKKRQLVILYRIKRDFPYCKEAYQRYVEVLVGLKDYGKAKLAAEKIVEKFPYESDGHFYKILSAYHLKDQKWQEYLQHAIKLFASSPAWEGNFPYLLYNYGIPESAVSEVFAQVKKTAEMSDAALLPRVSASGREIIRTILQCISSLGYVGVIRGSACLTEQTRMSDIDIITDLPVAKIPDLINKLREKSQGLFTSMSKHVPNLFKVKKDNLDIDIFFDSKQFNVSGNWCKPATALNCEVQGAKLAGNELVPLRENCVFAEIDFANANSSPGKVILDDPFRILKIVRSSAELGKPISSRIMAFMDGSFNAGESVANHKIVAACFYKMFMDGNALGKLEYELYKLFLHGFAERNFQLLNRFKLLPALFGLEQEFYDKHYNECAQALALLDRFVNSAANIRLFLTAVHAIFLSIYFGKEMGADYINESDLDFLSFYKWANWRPNMRAELTALINERLVCNIGMKEKVPVILEEGEIVGTALENGEMMRPDKMDGVACGAGSSYPHEEFVEGESWMTTFAIQPFQSVEVEQLGLPQTIPILMFDTGLSLQSILPEPMAGAFFQPQPQMARPAAVPVINGLPYIPSMSLSDVPAPGSNTAVAVDAFLQEMSRGNMAKRGRNGPEYTAGAGTPDESTPGYGRHFVRRDNRKIAVHGPVESCSMGRR